MSFINIKAVAWAWEQNIKRASVKLTLLSLAKSASTEAYECYPSIATLCQDTGLNRKTVIDALKKLATDGLIANTGNRTGKTGKVNIFSLAIAALSDTKNTPIKQSQNRDDLKVNSPENGTHNSPENGTHNSPENGTRINKEEIIKGNKEKSAHAHEIKNYQGVRAPIPDGFQVTQQHRDFALMRGAPNPDGYIDKFIAHHQSKGTLSCNWDAELRKWMINERVFSAKGLSPAQERALQEPKRPKKLLTDGYKEPKPFSPGFSPKKLLEELRG